MNQPTIMPIPAELLIAHPENPNRMSKTTFNKLVKNIEQGGNYEPVIVRKHPDVEGAFEIINGHHRVKALRQLGSDVINCIEWDVDETGTRILLATLNTLSGKDELAAKSALIKNLCEKSPASELAKILPNTKAEIEKLRDITKPIKDFAKDTKAFLNTLVFFLDDTQAEVVGAAVEKALPAEGSTAQKNAAAITHIAKKFMA